ncbi:MAG TPA: DISARM system helicase DrmA [Opitutaceae bacterium]|nr:DISARM system helicase DrmA [Lacunisphaera sp.]HWA10444.1 DISARM system helicase DrmA [Opitutaceae bacterium]
MTSSETRAKLVEALRLDLVGPWPGHAFAGELLPENPNRWYLTGYLVPETAPVHQREDAEAKEEIDSGAEGGGMDDAGAPDKSAPPSLLPSSMGLSVLVPAGASKLKAEVTWGDYHWEDPSKEDEEPGDQGLGVPDETKQESDEQSESPVAPANEPLPAASAAAAPKGFRRTPHAESVEISLPAPGSKLVEVQVPNSGGLRVVVTARAVTPDSHGRLPVGTKAVCVFVVNGRQPGERAYQGNAFQACLRVTSPAGFIARPDLRGGEDGARRDDWDEQVADLQYRRSFDYVSGIGCAAEAIDMEEGGPCHAVQTCWIPSAEVEFVGHLESSALAGVELSMEALSLLGNVDEARTKLGGLVDLYRAWITTQESAIKADVALEANRLKAANELFRRARLAADRMSAGIELLAKDDIREAFCTANRAMARQARQRDAQKYNIAPDKAAAPSWRAFQLGFILLNLRGLADPLDHDRQLVDLLFFPTGGGKTEAYLGLAAFSLVLRRLRNPGRRGAGVNVLMRYTLRLLTLDQLGRASALICALELERQERAKRSDLRLGDWPFEIGLWVGSAATPNRMGRPGDSGPGADMSAYRRVRRFRADSKKNPSPIPLENCPWCGIKFNAHSFRLLPSEKDPQDLRITCVNAKCAFTGDQPLPIIAVDEPIYRRLPCFLIATIDKFAALPWVGPSGKLFGLVERGDNAGFYSAMEPGRGKPLGGPLLPPELIIQDELHLISGPLGTIAGVYETAIGALAERDLPEGKKLRPKIIASTATVRQADAQIRALFGRPSSMVFPPPGPDRRDAFFAKTRPPSETPARLYLGIGAQGRSLKVVLLRAALALLSAGQTLYKQAGGKLPENPVDPYMTLLGYFNSLRELGGSRRIVEDEVTSQLRRYGARRRRDPADALFSQRKIGEPLELTSRVSTNQVSEAKRRLSQTHNEDDNVDLALATNMISVGLDITRLGLMVVLGQPKMSAEYIQATSRVGRDPKRPGLVVTLLNVHKPRDRSHYERFCFYHATFYRTVEATSVTPFSPRALDRALAASLVALARHQLAGMSAPAGAADILTHHIALNSVAETFADRAVAHRYLNATDQAALRAKVRDRCIHLLATWFTLADAERMKGAQLQYGTELSNQPALLHGFLDEALSTLAVDYMKFRANRSMRDVEASVDLFPQTITG